MSIQLDRILYQIEDTTVLRKKKHTDNFSTSNYDGIIGSGYTSNQNLSLSGGGENGSFT
jgi:hypothetical protein